MCSRSTAQRAGRPHRHGAAVLECALVLPVLFIVLFATLDLGLAALRYNALAEASRRVAREVIMHGALAPPTSGTWGPDEFNGTAADGSAIVASLVNVLPTMPNADVSVRVTWLEGDNSPRDPVQVELLYEHNPLIPGISLWGPITLTSDTTMHIIN